MKPYEHTKTIYTIYTYQTHEIHSTMYNQTYVHLCLVVRFLYGFHVDGMLMLCVWLLCVHLVPKKLRPPKATLSLLRAQQSGHHSSRPPRILSLPGAHQAGHHSSRPPRTLSLPRAHQAGHHSSRPHCRRPACCRESAAIQATRKRRQAPTQRRSGSWPPARRRRRRRRKRSRSSSCFSSRVRCCLAVQSLTRSHGTSGDPRISLKV